jgi:hypothetical protein
MAVDAFLKFDGLGGEGQKLGNDFDRLGDSFSDLGGAFIKLVDDGTSTDTNSLKADFAAQIKHDVFAIGTDFHKIGDAFIKLAGPLDTFDNAVVKFTDQFNKLGGDQSPLAADFLRFETDIKLTGADFLATAPEIKSDAPAESLSLNFSKISVDYKAQSADALSIKGDIAGFLDISGISESSALGMAFLKYSLDYQTISDAYLKLSTDFQQIASDFTTTGGQKGFGETPLTFEQAVIKFAGDFTTLSQDLKVADAALSGLGGDFHKLADAFENAGPSTTPSFKLG